MARMVDIRVVSGWFRLVALLEAVSWVGLLLGMYFKYLGSPRTEIGVKIFGPIHGGLFVAFVVIGVMTAIALKWTAATWLLMLLGGVVPLGSVIFLIWADRTGRMRVAVRSEAATGRGGALPETA